MVVEVEDGGLGWWLRYRPYSTHTFTTKPGDQEFQQVSSKEQDNISACEVVES